ncbi:MAG: hypothetical protein AAFP10_07615 [Pseudomonadota bacterium]
MPLNLSQAARAGYWAGIDGALGSQIGRRLDQLFSFSAMSGSRVIPREIWRRPCRQMRLGK